jgi:hypothetical protein
MLKLSKDKKGSKIREIKFDLRSFGADKIYVIHDPKRKQRKKDFIHAWGHFDGFEYEFVDAVTPIDFDINSLIQDEHPEFKLDSNFHDVGHLSMTKAILAIAFSHFRVYNKINHLPKSIDRILVLEDDARPSKALMDYIYSGEYKLFLNAIKRRHFNYLFLGTADDIIKGKDYSDILRSPETFTGLAAHAVLYDRVTVNRIIDNEYRVSWAADTFLHYLFNSDTFPNVYAPYMSFIEQQHKHIGSYHLDIDDPDYEYATSSQVYYADEKHPHIEKEMMQYIHKDYFKGKDTTVDWNDRIVKFNWKISEIQSLL